MKATKWSVSLLSSTLVFVGCQVAAEGEGEAAIRESVQASWEAWVDRTSTPLDFDGFMDLFLRDSTLEYVNSGQTRVGWDSIAAWHRRTWDTWDSAHVSIGRLRVEVLGPESAMISSDGDYLIRTNSGGETDGFDAATSVWRRTSSGWKMTHLHESFLR